MTKHLGYYIKPKDPKVEAPKKTKRKAKAKKIEAPVVIETEQQEMEQQIES